jgi:putative peptidoglycan lipid II flippase
LVATGTLLSRLTGLARLFVTVGVLGGGLLGDTYNAANNMPNIVYELLLGGIITATLVPIFVDAHERNDDRAVSAVFTVGLVVLAALTALSVVASPLIADLFARRSSYDVAVALVACFMPQVFFYGFTALASAELNARRRFVAAAFAPVVNNVLVIAILVFIAARYGAPSGVAVLHDDTALLLLVGLGTTAGIAATALVLVPALRRDGTRFHFVLEWRHPAVTRMARLSAWVLGYVAANQIALAVVLHIASRHSGEWVAYYSAFQFFQLPYGLFAVTIMTALAPELASAWRGGDLPWFRRDFARGLRFLLLVIVPSAVGLFVVARPIAELLHHGSFHAQDVARTGDALAAFGVGLVSFTLYLYALRAFYAMGDTRTPFFVNCVENALNIVFALALHGRYGVRGLALAFSLAYVLMAVVALRVLDRRLGGLGAKSALPTAARATLAAILAGLVAFMIAGRTSARDSALLLVLAVLAAVTVYAAVLVATGSTDVRELFAVARRRPRPDAGDAAPVAPNV